MVFLGADTMRTIPPGLLLLVSLFANLHAQDGARYVPEPDPIVRKSLEAWQTLKFGLLIHWGPYSQWGVVESWSICAEDEDWCRRSDDDYVAYKKRYESLPQTFNPTRFDPDRWAAAAQAAGMKYLYDPEQ